MNVFISFQSPFVETKPQAPRGTGTPITIAATAKTRATKSAREQPGKEIREEKTNWNKIHKEHGSHEHGGGVRHQIYQKTTKKKSVKCKHWSFCNKNGINDLHRNKERAATTVKNQVNSSGCSVVAEMTSSMEKMFNMFAGHG